MSTHADSWLNSNDCKNLKLSKCLDTASPNITEPTAVRQPTLGTINPKIH